jgi:hypothetical protein
MLHFWAKGAIIQPATFAPIILSVPFLALCMMMGNNVIRAEGKAKFVVAMIIPLLILGWIFFYQVMDLE